MNPGKCLRRGCGRFHTDRDIHGLCPDHYPAPVSVDRTAAVKSLERQYPALKPAAPEPERAMKIGADEIETARRMLSTLSERQLAALQGSSGRVPDLPGWKRVHCSCRLPTFMAGVAQAVAVGSYILLEDTV